MNEILMKLRIQCLFAILALTGCLGRAVNTVGPEAQAVNEPNYGKVTVSGWLGAKASVFGIRHDIVNGVLRAQLDIRNLTPMEQKIEYQFVWLDANGGAVGQTSTHWFPATLSAGQVKNVVEFAPTALAVDYRFEVRGR
jgi:uncharacterized protein YcfL